MQWPKHLDAYRKRKLMQDGCPMAGPSIVMASFATHELFGIGHVREKQ
jgi:hypothetical protein